MSQEILTKYFGIHPERSFYDGEMDRYLVGELLYSIVPVTNLEQETLVELYNLTEHLSSAGDIYVSSFVPTSEEKFLVTERNEDFVVVKNNFIQAASQKKVGRKLSKLHYRGRLYQERVEKISRMGKWKQLWETRLAQLESAYLRVVEQHPGDEFERKFVESYPYYSALAENAIQYLVDTELDDEPKETDAGTVCHERFGSKTWGNEVWIHFPFQWVFDHCSRDLAEWVREKYFLKSNTFHHDLQEFLRSYQTITPLSSFSWRLLYARLLFPLHYFECIEEYYISQSDQQRKTMEEKLERYLKQSQHYERFLAEFYHLSEVPVKKLGIPVIDWLQ
jgi:spore coat protein YutH